MAAGKSIRGGEDPDRALLVRDAVPTTVPAARAGGVEAREAAAGARL